MATYDRISAVGYNGRNVVGYSELTAADQVRFADLVAMFQADHGLGVDGKYGPKTRAALDAATAAAPVADPPVVVTPPLAPASLLRQAVVDRSRRAAAQQCYYDLGSGGSDKAPDWPTWPWNAQHQCDCSAFVDWAVAAPPLAPFARNDGDWNTAKQVADAVRFDRQKREITGIGPEKRFRAKAFIRQIGMNGAKPVYVAFVRTVDAGTGAVTFEPATLEAALAQVKAADVVVHDGQYDPKTGVRKQPGHTGVLTAFDLAALGAGTAWWECGKAVHCSPHNSAAAGEAGHAIAETNLEPWKREAMFLEYIPLGS